MPDYARRRPHLLGGMLYSPLSFLKVVEVKLLRKRASTYCYNYPGVIQVETTNRCNLNCHMCPRVEELKKKGIKARDMSYEEFKTIIDQTRGVYSINPFGRGEPLMANDIFRMIDYCVEKRIPHVSITTNGLLLKGNRAKALSETKLSELRVSVDGADEETYRKIRKADLNELISNLKDFRRISDIPMSINFVLGEENRESALKMPALTAEVGAQCLRVFHMLGEHSPLEQKQLPGTKDLEGYAELTKTLRKRCSELGIAFIIANREETSCLWPFVMAFIDIDGYLTPCCKLEHIRLANVFEAGLFPAWNAEPMRQWRRNLLSGRIPKVCTDIHCISK